MTHRECTELVSLNYDLFNHNYKGSKIRAFTIIENSSRSIVEEIKKVLKNPEVSASSVEGRSYEVYIVLNKNEFGPLENVEHVHIDELLLHYEFEEF
jgi:hypothetical protein